MESQKQAKKKEFNYFNHFFSGYTSEDDLKNHFLGKIEKKIKIKDKNNFFVFKYKTPINTKIDISIIDYNLKKNKLKFIIYKKNTYQIFIYIFLSTTIKKNEIEKIEKYLNSIKINVYDKIKLINDVELPFFNQKLKINYFLKNKKRYYFDDFNKLVSKNIINLNSIYDYIKIEKKKITNFMLECNIQKIISLKRTYYILEHKGSKIFLSLNDLMSQSKIQKKILCDLGYFLSSVQKNQYKSFIESMISKLSHNEITYLNKKKIIKNIFLTYLKENLNLESCGDNITARSLLLKGYPIIQFYRYDGKRKKCVCFKHNLFFESVQDKIIYYNLKYQDFYNEFKKNNFYPVMMNIYYSKSKIKKTKILVIPLDFVSNFI